MTRYSFTGPSRLTQTDLERARTVVAFLDEPAELTTGAATGWDMAVAHVAVDVWPDALHRVIIPSAPHDALGVERFRGLARSARVKTEIVQMPTAKEAYRRRNEALVAAADVLVAAVHGIRFYRSGEHMTVNIAKRAGVPVEFVDLGEIS